MQFNGH